MTQTVPKGILLDTCATLWLLEGSPLAVEAREAIADAERKSAVYLSPISVWEIGMLVAKHRIALAIPPERWIDSALNRPGVQLADMPPQVLLDSSFLPGSPPGDPADRIIIATARHLRLSVITRDQPILDYAKLGHVAAQAC